MPLFAYQPIPLSGPPVSAHLPQSTVLQVASCTLSNIFKAIAATRTQQSTQPTVHEQVYTGLGPGSHEDCCK